MQHMSVLAHPAQVNPTVYVSLAIQSQVSCAPRKRKVMPEEKAKTAVVPSSKSCFGNAGDVFSSSETLVTTLSSCLVGFFVAFAAAV